MSDPSNQAPVEAALSTTEVGDTFRDSVCQLLRTQFPDVVPEKWIGGTKVDIYFTQHAFGKRDRIAVECKNYDTPLTKSYIERDIFPKYHPMLDSNLIDSVVIVSRKHLGSAARAYVDALRGVRHQTFEELEEHLLGVRGYVEGLATLRPTEDAEYVEGRFVGCEGAALASIEEWVSTVGSNGLAILGSYGQGKSSLARRVAAHFAQAYFNDQTGRIPIRKTLGDVVHETRLEGLFGAEFTADTPLPGYQFKTLEHLNQSGRLLVILDGFDEMKHAMTASDFVANFREFNRLLKGKSKVLLLGRPNAMPSDTQDLVFRGLKTVAGQVVASPDFRPWTQRTLDFFTPAESCGLLESTLANVVASYAQQGRFTYLTSFVSDRTAEILSRVPSELLKRPVHVQLIAGLAADPGFDLEGFNEYRLYEHFIRSMVERDTLNKRARKAIPLEARLQFQRDLAWWAWRRQGKAQGSFLRDEIPESVLDSLPWGNAADFEGKRNEYIVSTLTEEKDAGVLYFAHRSFQEFLVADRLQRAKPTPNSHQEYAAHLTPDVMSFLIQTPDQEFIDDWYFTLTSCAFPLPSSYLKFYLNFPRLIEAVTADALENVAGTNMWAVAIVTMASRTGRDGAAGSEALNDFLHKATLMADSQAAALAVLALMQRLTVPTSQPEWLPIASALIERSLRSAREHSDAMALSIMAPQYDFAAKWLGHVVEKEFPQKGGLESWKLVFEAGKLAALCTEEINNKLPEGPGIFGDSSAFRSALPVRLEALKTFMGVDEDLRKTHEKFLRQRRRSFNVVSYEQKKMLASWARHKAMS